MRRIFLYLVLLFALPCRGSGASGGAAVSSALLLERGRCLTESLHMADSALLYLTDVLARYYDNPANPQVSAQAVAAMRSMSDVYWNSYHDYGTAISMLTAAIELAEAEDMTQELPYLYLDMARFWDTNGLAFKDGNAVAEDYMRKAYDAALRGNNLGALSTVAFNMCVFRIARAQKLFGDELADISRREAPADAACRTQAPLYIEAVHALESKDYAAAEKLFHEVAATPAANSEERRAVLGAMQLESEMRRLRGDAHGARRLLLGYLAQRGVEATPGHSQAICRKLAALYKLAGMEDSAALYDARWLREREAGRQNSLLTPSEMERLASVPSAELRVRKVHIAKLKRERQLICVVAGALVILLAGAFALRAWKVQKRNARTLFEQNKALLEDASQMRMLRARLEQARRRDTDPKRQKYDASVIDRSMSADLYQKLLHIMDTSQDIYNTGFLLKDLASLADMQPRHVSQIINENSGTNFNQLLNQYRIREVQRRLRDREAYGNLTIEAVAESVGFMSRSTFAQIFKRHTGLTPTQYRSLGQQAC